MNRLPRAAGMASCVIQSLLHESKHRSFDGMSRVTLNRCNIGCNRRVGAPGMITNS